MADTTPAKPKKAPAKPKAAAKPRTKPAKPAEAKAEPAAASPVDQAKAKFAKAIDDARAGAEKVTKQAQASAEAYREKLAGQSEVWLDEAKAYGEQAKDYAEQAKERAAALARDGKTRTSEAISGLGKIVSENAEVIEDKLGAKYGDYARSAARSMQETAAKIEAKDLNELGEDAKEFVRKSPGVAIGLAAVAGFLVARLLKGGSND